MREVEIEFEDGPFAGRKAVVMTGKPGVPSALHVTADGGIISPDLIYAGNPEALEETKHCWLYLKRFMTPRGQNTFFLSHGPLET